MSLSLQQAYNTLLEEASTWLQSGSPKHITAQSIASLSAPIVSIDVLNWLDAQQHQPKVLWSDRDQHEIFAGLSIAWEVVAHNTLTYNETIQKLGALVENASPEVRFMGGCRFDATRSCGAEWQKWPAAQFILPRIAIRKNKNETRLMAFIPRFSAADEKVALDALYELLSQLSGVLIEHKTSTVIARYQNRREVVGKQQWSKGVTQALTAIQNKSLEKVVLARAVDFTLEDNAMDCLTPLKLLQALRQNVSWGFHFCFQIDEKRSFFGVTPELLYHRKKDSITSEALAGTTRKGCNLEEDNILSKILQNNDKERREHLAVLEYLVAILKPLCAEIQQIDLMQCLKLDHIQHLRSRLRGTLSPNIGDADLIGALHPTPAVAGSPRTKAYALIKKIESFDRGWYAGSVGWIGRDEAQFAVAIRSGLLTDNTLRVYAGAGIVLGSEASSEWDETENKLSNWTTLLRPL